MNQPSFPSSQPSQPAFEQAGQQPVVATRPVQPTVTYVLLGVTVVVFVLQLLTEAGLFREPFIALGRLIFGSANMDALLSQGWGSDLLVLLGGKINELIVAGQYWRLLTPALLHASMLHILFNMYALYALGRTLEPQYGNARFLILYLLGALGGNTLSFLMSPRFSVGASTAIFGLIAAEGIFIFQNRRMFGDRAKPALQSVATILVINLFLGLTSRGIDNWGHLGGLAAGAAFAWFAGPLLSLEGLWPSYQVTDRRSNVQAVLTAAVVAAVLIGLVLWGITRAS